MRSARKQRGWTRHELRDAFGRLGVEVSIQTIATWELGTRACTTVRVWQYCDVLEISISDLFTRVHKRMGGDRQGITIDLAATSTTRSPRLAPLRAWARLRRRANPNKSTELLELAALEPMARLCELSTVDLTQRLYQAGVVRPESTVTP